jgi:hypothetical protein
LVIVEVLFAREQFNVGMPWTELAPLLPGWRIRACPSAELADHLSGVDVVCPFGTPLPATAIASGEFGLVQQFGVGLDGIDMDAATHHGVWVARLPGELTGNADSVAELAVLYLLALVRRFDDARRALRERRWGEPMSRSVADCTVLVVGLGAVGRAVVARLRPFGPRIVAVRAHPERGVVAGVEQVVGTSDLVGAVGQADVVICAAMLDADSRGLLIWPASPSECSAAAATCSPPTSSAGSPANPRSGRPTRLATNGTGRQVVATSRSSPLDGRRPSARSAK